ncbi:hypothetical protein [uncultured Acetatifactor sp.]|jgi:hypothetical protein|uniref:hypothetical protein n=1 Tax=uncultured Acetatifactor sp. TaxID=1671927 RepID=UPI0026194E9E|nr:hypothetical protein [uncultured Acetatifactor sp.]
MDDYKMNFYVDYINRNVLDRIDYARLQEDYQTEEKAYAKSVLNALHRGILGSYGTEVFDRDTLEEGLVLLPGVLQCRENGNVCITLLELDLSSSGEHCGTDYLTKYGCVSLREEGLPEAVRQFLMDTYGTYEYGYTATIRDDIHVDRDGLPEAVKEVLADFRSHAFMPCTRRMSLDSILELDQTEDGDMEVR